jgi:iron(III) transport system permease protein
MPFWYRAVMKAAPAQPEGTVTDYYLLRTLTSRMSELLLWTPMLNTLAVALSTVAGAMVVGVALAWLDQPYRYRRQKVVCHPADRAVYAAFLDLRAGVEHHFQKPRHRRTAGWLEAMGIQTPNWMAYGYFRSSPLWCCTTRRW